MARRFEISFHYPRRDATGSASPRSLRPPVCRKQGALRYVQAACILVVFSGVLLVGAAIGTAVAVLLAALVALALAAVLVRGVLVRPRNAEGGRE